MMQAEEWWENIPAQSGSSVWANIPDLEPNPSFLQRSDYQDGKRWTLVPCEDETCNTEAKQGDTRQRDADAAKQGTVGGTVSGAKYPSYWEMLARAMDPMTSLFTKSMMHEATAILMEKTQKLLENSDIAKVFGPSKARTIMSSMSSPPTEKQTIILASFAAFVLNAPVVYGKHTYGTDGCVCKDPAHYELLRLHPRAWTLMPKK